MKRNLTDDQVEEMAMEAFTQVEEATVSGDFEMNAHDYVFFLAKFASIVSLYRAAAMHSLQEIQEEQATRERGMR
jgi:hypothetical protein